MSTAQHLLALVKSHVDGDNDTFLSLAMQVAAREARSGHTNVAAELRKLIDQARQQRGLAPRPSTALPLRPPQPQGELGTLLSVSYPSVQLRDMVLPQSVEDRLDRIIKEHVQQERLRSHGLSPRRKILLVGPPGSGKTMTAHALAATLHLPLMTILLEGVITRFMGDTAAKLRLVFDAMANTRGIYLFDEFDAIGARRTSGNDVGEIRRVLNSFLQFLEQDDSASLVIAATNHPELLDPALFRRFDDVVEYQLPDTTVTVRLLQARLAPFLEGAVDWEQLAGAAQGLSQSEIARAAEDAAKTALLDGRTHVQADDIEQALEERRQARR